MKLDDVRNRLKSLKAGGPLTVSLKGELAEDAEALLARVDSALCFLVTYAQIDGDHHKMWVLDQVLRSLLGCPLESVTALDVNGKTYSYERQGESTEYKAFVVDACAGVDGPNTYEWDTGTPP